VRDLLAVNWRTIVLWLALFTVVLIAGAALLVASGIYNVAASVPHLGISERLIEFALRRSVATHSFGVTAPDLADEGLVRLGANHFRLGCAPCHGSPARSNDPVVEQMYPAPPPLGQAVGTWDATELFWIVKHGLKFTGMPAWSGAGRDDEVWAVVAFLRRFPAMDEGEFRNLIGADHGAFIEFGEQQPPRAGLCISCHGDADSPPISARVPVLQGQSSDYLRRALEEYGRNKRQSGIMEPIAAALDERMIGDAVRFYAETRPARSPRGEGNDREALRRGRMIAENGVPDDQIPPCLACHSGRASTRFPALAGLSAEYLRGQLQLFHDGTRDQTAYGAIMTAIAQRLTSSQMSDAAAYFSTLPAGGTIAPGKEGGEQ